ncbi:MAG: 23S rRNA (adenine(2503)-C(2))-methyltransferase RlmN [Oscillospiraceae bacterium]|nr:23S rRNA (adenine(2503)-C(2))-methyltransferase RlmN [Oscillospiraceae bacterium]
MDLKDLKSLEFSELKALTEEIGEPGYRAKQIFSWLHKGAGFDDMTNISKSARQKLSEVSFISGMRIAQKYVSRLDGTVKYLFEADDGNCVEGVVMRYKHGISMCISSQVGCGMGCGFCASTIGGRVRNLSAGEIISQIITARLDMGERIDNIVMMGIGEPLDNYDNVIKFLRNVNHGEGLNIGYRHISLSTCGLVNRIYDLAEENLPITLSVSLHAPNNEIRGKLMPVNRKFPVEVLIKACREYIKATGRRISFEYSLISGVNDSEENARELAELLSGMLCHVNLIPVNHVEETGFYKGSREEINKFRDRLVRLGVNATIRRELGSDISASCGQLRKRNMRRV